MPKMSLAHQSSAAEQSEMTITMMDPDISVELEKPLLNIANTGIRTPAAESKSVYSHPMYVILKSLYARKPPMPKYTMTMSVMIGDL